MDSHDKLRIVVVGDSGVGKTCLVHILCHNEVLRNPTWTIGSSVEVTVCQSVQSNNGFLFVRLNSINEIINRGILALQKHIHTRTMKPYFVEFVDVGGSTKHPSSRNMFYHHVDGIILVHDVSNRKSYYNLWRWIAEVLNSDAFKEEGERVMNGSMMSMSGSSGSGSGFLVNSNLKEYDFELQIGDRNLHVPILVVGTKADLVKQELTGRQRRYSIVDEYGGDCVNVCTLAPTHFARGSIAAEKIDAFFDTVIDKKFHHLQSPAFATTNSNTSSTIAFTSSSSLGNNARDDYRRRTLNISTAGVAASSSSSSNNNNNVILSGLGSPGFLSKSSATANGVGISHPNRTDISRDFSSPSKKTSWHGFRNSNTFNMNQWQLQQESQQKSRVISPRPSSSRVFTSHNNGILRTPTRTTNSTNTNATTTQSSSWYMNSGDGGDGMEDK
ncbi:12271_t:CDS:2 [Ambispora leptoticha]|uniref:12271_t:CDS:1 n=1 Tax=Ambispora leptoticha TaxID=144679 RepID=A0A9N9C308_9GLOM|nr:12271_t:CDS:2 [Ambispora leptoticha]